MLVKFALVAVSLLIAFGHPVFSGLALSTLESAEDLAQAKAHLDANATDSKAHFAYAEALRKAGRSSEAAKEYLAVTTLDSSNYLAFHLLATTSCDSAQLEEAIASLQKLKQDKPTDLMLRVALSELLEKKGDYYQAARVLVDLVYQNAVPERYVAKINVRIHYLLARAKDVKTSMPEPSQEEDLDKAVQPLPYSSMHQNLTVSKIKEGKTTRSVGHAPLLP